MIDWSIWKKAWAVLDARERRNAWVTLVVVILGALSSALMVGSVIPFLSVLSDPDRIGRISVLAWAFEAFGFADSYTFLVALGVASFAVIVATSFMQIVKTYIVARFSMMRIHSISHRLLVAYLRQPYPFFLNRHSGQMGTLVLAESEQMVVRFLRPAAEFIAAIFTIMAIVTVLVWVDPIVALVAFGVMGGIYAVVYIISRRVLKKNGYIRTTSNSERFRIVNEALGGIKDIKLLGREGSYAARYAEPSKRMALAIVNVQLLSQIPQLALQAIAFGGIILLCLILMDASVLETGGGLRRNFADTGGVCFCWTTLDARAFEALSVSCTASGRWRFCSRGL